MKPNRREEAIGLAEANEQTADETINMKMIPFKNYRARLGLLALSALLLPGCSHLPHPRTGYRVFDVHLHALNPEEMKQYATVDFGAHRKTAHQNVTDPEVLLQKTIEYLDR